MTYVKSRPGFIIDPAFHVATKTAVDRREAASPARFPERQPVDMAAYRAGPFRPAPASRDGDWLFYAALVALSVSSALLGALFVAI